jgi:hypothetical protein
MKTTATKLFLMASVISFFFLANPNFLFSQSTDPVTTTSVWEVTFVKIKPHSGEQYIAGLKQTWKSSMDELQKAGFIKSYKILWGEAANESDFDMMLMVQYPNYASFDSNPDRDKKMEEIEKKIKDGLGDQYSKIIEGYTSLRELLGTKVMSEVTIN